MNTGWTEHTPRASGASFKKLRRRIHFAVQDWIYRWRNPDTMVPPKSLDFVGGTNFEEVGKEFARHFVELGKLLPHHQVLDVGCGIGRMAIPLTQYLSKDGAYYGFDIVEEGIRWCNSRIAPRYPNFHFIHSDVYNLSYNRSGKILAKDYKFPFEDASFDFVFLTSVFTHMQTVELRNYLKEISRVMKRGGRCLITFFVINQESRQLMQAGKSTQNFQYELDGCFTINTKVPEYAIAYTEEDVLKLFAENNLSIEMPIRYGSWCGRSQFLTYQDVVLATKR